MLIDPQSITIGSGSAVTLPRILTGSDLGRFLSADANLKLEVQTTRGARTRTVARLVQQKVVADPLVGTVNVRVGDTVALTINRPASGFSDEEILAQVKGFISWLTAGTDANLKKVIAGEN